MRDLYRSLLNLYPRAYRREYGDEMMAVLAEVQREIRNKSPWRRIAFTSREIVGLLCGALQERLHRITHARNYIVFSPRRFAMSSDFRFPKSAVSLMAMILVAVFMVIDKAKSIQQSMPYTNPQIGPIHVAQVTVVPTMLLLLGIACAGGAAVWLVLFLLHRSGVHRLSDARPSSTPRGSSLSI